MSDIRKGIGEDALRDYREQLEPRASERRYWVAIRIWLGIGVFYFASFVFAFFYLKITNNYNRWDNPPVSAPMGWAIAVLAAIVVAGILFFAGERRPAGSQPSRSWAVVSEVLLLVAIAIQVWELMHGHLGFSPGHSGYTSVFVGWTISMVVWELGAAYWLWTLLAETPYRGSRKTPDGYAGSKADAQILLAQYSAFGLFLYFLGLVEVITFVCLYLIK
jgi:hypothetical protein